VTERGEVVASADLLLHPLQGGRGELHDPTATHADEVVVVLVAEGVLVVGVTLTETDLTEDTTGDQQFQGAINGSLRGSAAGLSHLTVQLVGLKVTLSSQGRPQHGPPLGCDPEALTTQVLSKALLGLCSAACASFTSR